MLAACASRNEPVVRVTPVSVPGTTLPSEGIESVRYAEDIKAYSLGRYVDPNNPGIMHEAHTIYQVETNAPVSMPLGPVRVRDSAKTTTPVANELIVELNQQKEATKSIMQGGQLVSQKLSELANKLQQTQQIVTQNAQLKQEVVSTAQRLDALEEQLREQQGANHTASPDNIPKDTPSDW